MTNSKRGTNRRAKHKTQSEAVAVTSTPPAAEEEVGAHPMKTDETKGHTSTKGGNAQAADAAVDAVEADETERVTTTEGEETHSPSAHPSVTTHETGDDQDTSAPIAPAQFCETTGNVTVKKQP